jgi:hypothetical protein
MQPYIIFNLKVHNGNFLTQMIWPTTPKSITWRPSIWLPAKMQGSPEYILYIQCAPLPPPISSSRIHDHIKQCALQDWLPTNKTKKVQSVC